MNAHIEISPQWSSTDKIDCLWWKEIPEWKEIPGLIEPVLCWFE